MVRGIQNVIELPLKRTPRSFSLQKGICPGPGCKKEELRGAERCRAGAQTPLIDALLQFKTKDTAPFHIPGHKRGLGCSQHLKDIIDPQTLQFDLTELPGLDNLADPTEAIAESQNLAANVFDAEKTWYLINGTTAGLQAALLATCPSKSVVVARNCHISVFNALVLAGARPRWIQPEVCPHSQVALHVTVTSLELALEEEIQARHKPCAVVVVSPTYYGIVSDVEGLAKCCHQHGIPLIVDEAHGAHFGLHPGFPNSAMQQGADISVQSTHKTLASMGQSSMLHCQGPLVNKAKLGATLRLLQTTSPSYLLMASLDAAQAMAHDWKSHEIELPYESLLSAKDDLRRLPGILLLEDLVKGVGSSLKVDPWRITIVCTSLSLSGHGLGDRLEREFDVYPELSTQHVVAFAAGPGTQQAHLVVLVKALKDISKVHGSQQGVDECSRASTSFQAPIVGLSPREAFFAETELISTRHAAGRLSAELICPYPPGIPIVCPGERFTVANIDTMLQVLEAGGTLTGACDKTLSTVRVIEELR